jgi:hypothetical protein
MNNSSSQELVVRPGMSFDGVKVFSATMFQDRERLGDKVTDWLSAHRDAQIMSFTVTQSSDASFHCIAITVFYSEAIAGR